MATYSLSPGTKRGILAEARVREGRSLVSLASSRSRFLLRLEDEDDLFSSCACFGGGRIASVIRSKVE